MLTRQMFEVQVGFTEINTIDFSPKEHSDR